MNELKTDGALLERLREASQQKPSAAEIHHQRVSFIMASMSDKKGVTRAKVEQVLAVQEGR